MDDDDIDIDGGDGADLIKGSEFGEIIDGGSGDDTIEGNAGPDTIDGGAGVDVLKGGTEADTINGGAGVDIIYGGPGSDVIDGQTDDGHLIDYASGENISNVGAVLVTWTSAAGLLEVEAATGTYPSDALDLSLDLNGSTLEVNLGGYTVSSYTNSSVNDIVIEGSNEADTIDCSGAGSNYDSVTIYGYDGVDTVDGTDANDKFFGGDGADVFDGNTGDFDYIMDYTSTDGTITAAMKRIWYMDSTTISDWDTNNDFDDFNYQTNADVEKSGFQSHSAWRNKSDATGATTAISANGSNAMKLGVIINHIVPDLLSDSVDTWISRQKTSGSSNNRENHCMFNIRESSLVQSIYLEEGTKYRLAFTADVNDEVGKRNSWTVIAQMHPGTFGSFGSSEVPVGVYVYKDGYIPSGRPSTPSYRRFALEARGGTTSYVDELTEDNTLAFEDGELDFVLDITPNHLGNGHVKCTIDGTTLGEVTSKIGIPRTVSGTDVGGWLSLGTYTGGTGVADVDLSEEWTTSETPHVKFKKVELFVE